MNPEPSEDARGPGDIGPPPLSPKNSRNTSSSVLPGEFCAWSWPGVGTGGPAWVEMLTTALTSLPASWANKSANGPCGRGSAGGVSDCADRLGGSVAGDGFCGLAAAGDSCASARLGAGVPGAWARPGTAITAHKASEVATMASRRRNILTAL